MSQELWDGKGITRHDDINAERTSSKIRNQQQEIESLRQQLEVAEACLAGDDTLIAGLTNDIAEKDAEIERLQQKLGNEVTFDGKTAFEFVSEELFNFQNATGCNTADEYQQQLAASQAREQQLREALKIVDGNSNYPITKEALAMPQDTTALQAMIAKAGEVMRERCRKVAFDMASADSMAVDVSQSIRALPAVTLSDLK